LKHITTALAFTGLVTFAATAGAEITGNVAMTSDYLFRGISQSDNDPAIQGGFDYSHESGFYAGTWASSVSFDGNVEIDLYAGFGGETAGGLAWDLGAIAYQYPGDSSGVDSDFEEVYGSLGFDFGVASVTAGLAYSPDYFAESDDAYYYYLDAGIPLGEMFSLALHYGHQDIDDNAAFGTPDYDDYSVGVSTEQAGLGFDLTLSDTDLNTAECFGGDSICDSTVVFTVSKSL
jgi:uncharacterized protein (TIGR02001 family)